MARKLTFLLTDKTAWKLLVRTALGILALYFLRQFDFSPAVFVAALFIFLVIYFTLSPERKILRRSILLLVFLGMVGSKILAGASFWPRFGFGCLWTLGFFALLGLTEFFFVNREQIYGLLNTLILFFSFAVFFYLNRGGNFWALGLILVLLLVSLFSEALRFFEAGAPRRTFFLSAAAGFVVLELAWILGFLPLGFLNAALFLTLISFLLRDTVVFSLRGKLNLPLILRELAILFVLGLTIFAASSWSI